MLNINIEKLKNNKKLIIVGMILIIGTFIVLLVTTKEELETTIPPVVYTEREGKETPNMKVYLEKVVPEEGRHESIDTFERIAFKFNQPINPDDIEVTPTPYIGLTAEVPEEYPNILHVYPTRERWADGRQYELKIMIKGLGSTNYTGFKYTYLRVTPQNVVGGDGGSEWKFLY